MYRERLRAFALVHATASVPMPKVSIGLIVPDSQWEASVLDCQGVGGAKDTEGDGDRFRLSLDSWLFFLDLSEESLSVVSTCYHSTSKVAGKTHAYPKAVVEEPPP